MRRLGLIVFGASNYDYAPEKNNPRFAASAKAFQELFANPNLVPDNTTEVLDLYDQVIYPSEIASKAETFVQNGSFDDLIFYYCGHGSAVFSQRSYSVYLRTTNPRALHTGLLNIADFRKDVRSWKSSHEQRIMFVLDACYSGDAIDQYNEGMDGAARPMNDAALVPASGISFFTASEAGEIALAKQTDERTLFTGTLVEVVKNGIAIRSELQRISWQDVRDDVLRRTRQRLGDNAPTPKLQTLEERHGDVSRMPFFNNLAFKPDSSPPPALTYLDISFEPDSAATKELFGRLDEESSRSTISLTPLYGREAIPAFFTPNMARWYSRFVQPYRMLLLDDISKELQAGRASKGHEPPFILEVERDRIEMHKYEAMQIDRDAFLVKSDASAIHRELIEKSHQYSSIKADHRRDAQRRIPYVYWFVLLAIMAPGVLTNWWAFAKLSFLSNSPALALAAALSVAACLAFSSDRIGKAIKQRRHQFGGGTTAIPRRRYLEIGLGLIAFCIGIGIVLWSRYMPTTDIVQTSVPAREEVGSGILAPFGGEFLENLGTWLLGMLWSFSRHDSVPEFSELQEEVEKLERELSRFYAALGASYARHNEAAARLVRQLNRTDSARQARETGPQRARQLFGLLHDKDDEALALLAEYRGRLIAKMQLQSRDAVFLIDDISKVDMDIRVQMPADVYVSTPLQFRYA
jgi:hypothetical protein